MWEIDDGCGALEIKKNAKNIVSEVRSVQSSRRSLKFVIYFPVLKSENQYERKPSRTKSIVIMDIVQIAF